MNYLVDTNIFLEILLNQAGRKKCEAFLQGEKGAAWISDFTLHSIGVLLFRQKRTDLFDKFTADTLSQFTILSLSVTGYATLGKVNLRNDLDFDDAYQFAVALENKLAIATQDKDFQRVRNLVEMHLL
ncbi:MAG TPA: PIN domain-containing protein [Verrucomicrobiae bacterium]|jgi:predicted nucleic acid-binding protein|nr:PIN domain-containing protein [Verrucomicrobiae bacterium]